MLLRVTALLLVVAAGLTIQVDALKKIDAPCTACKSVAAELQRKINKEPVRNHLDLRHRLDKHGQRYGKVIAYKSSELRAVELLDGLCERMRDYALVSPTGKKTKFWLKVKGEGAASTANVTRSVGQEEDSKSKRLEAYCGTLVEEYEEDIYEGIMKGGFDSEGVEPVLCRSIIKPCPAPAPPAEDGSVAPEVGEVVEADEDAEDLEAAAAAAAASSDSSSAASDSSSGAPGSQDGETKYIENMTIEVGKDGKFEL
ncbi:hypothetical protein HYH02_003480 [Chlamydomonas schloesseri]|uniref:DUF3456 domain-containing protein n=1 Tax=Chlamydomonas schloesseri TaxID=2026947 RepID=A0A836B9V0_9CHLO|nr:hypothetical protein HYH02_003480 [Chlamydomonas schloesseri]|eukprot:KAG2451700.1 hypothetical protein HYH02_003480 [Chlamydomonas schloesseri]